MIRRLIDPEWGLWFITLAVSEGNQYADALTNLVCSIGVGCVFFYVCPSEFSHLLTAYILEISTPRLIVL
jgi:hypothetical protein